MSPTWITSAICVMSPIWVTSPACVMSPRWVMPPIGVIRLYILTAYTPAVVSAGGGGLMFWFAHGHVCDGDDHVIIPVLRDIPRSQFVIYHSRFRRKKDLCEIRPLTQAEQCQSWRRRHLAQSPESMCNTSMKYARNMWHGIFQRQSLLNIQLSPVKDPADVCEYQMTLAVWEHLFDLCYVYRVGVTRRYGQRDSQSHVFISAYTHPPHANNTLPHTTHTHANTHNCRWRG